MVHPLDDANRRPAFGGVGTRTEQCKKQALTGLVHHSDRGSQYVSIRYSERLEEAGITPSVGSRGDCLLTG